ncbi:hypothetical protein Dimus_034757 [Dionaea muscipula]
MRQVDLAAVCGGGTDRKITCETLADGDADTAVDPQPPSQAHDPDPVGSDPEPPQPDYAPDSFWLSKDAELDWLDRNAYIERKDSGKGGAAPGTSHSGNLNSASQRYAVNLKKSRASIFGLPKPQKTNYAESNLRRQCRPRHVWVLPKRADSASGKSGAAMTEPSSPKVSCMGRVRSRGDKSRRTAGNHRRNHAELPALMKSKSVKKKRTGFWKTVRSIFRSRGPKLVEEENQKSSEEKPAKQGGNTESVKTREFSSAEAPVEPPRLGSVQRFSSGRRSDAWAADVEVDGTKSEPLDGSLIWRRRKKAGSLGDVHVDVGRHWDSAGPISV